MDFNAVWQIIIVVIGALSAVWGTKSIWTYVMAFKETGDVYVSWKKGATDSELGKETREMFESWKNTSKGKKAENKANKVNK